MEKLCVLESTERWKIIRELRNAVNHEYEEDADRLTQFLRKWSKPHQNCLSTTSDYWISAPKLMGSSLSNHVIP